jgi:thymidine phosphorylase
MTWLPQETIRAKRDGGTLEAGELARLAHALANGSLSDAQAGAFAMAVQLRGMKPHECAAFTMAMRDTGEVFDWQRESPPGRCSTSTRPAASATSYRWRSARCSRPAAPGCR